MIETASVLKLSECDEIALSANAGRHYFIAGPWPAPLSNNVNEAIFS